MKPPAGQCGRCYGLYDTEGRLVLCPECHGITDDARRAAVAAADPGGLGPTYERAPARSAH